MTIRAASKFTGALALSLVLTGCVLSIEPVVSESDATFDPRLLGNWEDVADSARVVVSRASEKTYGIEYVDADGNTGTFEVRLGRLGDRLVLDLWPAPAADLPAPYADLLIGGHLLLALEIGTDEIRIAMIDPDSLLAALRAGAAGLAYISSGSQLILHGTTVELRSALGTYLRRPGALGNPDVWRRESGTRPPRAVQPPCFEAAAWREADELFHGDPHWMGADGASSVELGPGRTLWLFGDSWIDPSGAGTRRGARMVSNSVAIQTGTDPASATMTFYWGRAADGSPTAFIADHGNERHWFGNGIRVGDRLVLFLSRTISTKTGLGFEQVGWTAWMVENPDAEPSAWRMTPLETPANPLGVLVGFAAVLRLGDHVYALGSQDPVKSHPLFAARWKAEDVRRGNLQQPEWWAGERLGWVSDSSQDPRRPVFENGASELTVHVDEATKRFVAVQGVGFGPADVMMRAAPELTGPWSAPRMVYRPPEYYRSSVMIYAAKAHPQFTGADLVLTYATNTFQFSEHLTDSLIYYPRFVRLTRCR